MSASSFRKSFIDPTPNGEMSCALRTGRYLNASFDFAPPFFFPQRLVCGGFM
jgi:hypothetical protein